MKRNDGALAIGKLLLLALKVYMEHMKVKSIGKSFTNGERLHYMRLS